MCSTLRPRSSSRTRSPFSVSSLAAQPPEMPDPTTMASNWVACMAPLVTRSAPRASPLAYRSCGRESTVGDARLLGERHLEALRLERRREGRLLHRLHVGLVGIDDLLLHQVQQGVVQRRHPEL